MIGEKFGRLVVIEEGTPYISPKAGTSHVRYKCKCICGNIKIIRKSSLISGFSQSCGCLAKELAKERATVHGNSGELLFSRWFDMIRRCNDSSRKDFKHYGGRGIKVCDRWENAATGFKAFVEDMSNEFVQGLELDRIDVNGPYCKENCKWSTRQEQVNNRRPISEGGTGYYLTYNGITKTLKDWSSEVGLSWKCLYDRVEKLKWNPERALNTPMRIKQILIMVGERTYIPEQVFTYPPNVYDRAISRGVDFKEYCAALLKNIATIKTVSNGKISEIKTELDFTSDISVINFKLNLEETL